MQTQWYSHFYVTTMSASQMLDGTNFICENVTFACFIALPFTVAQQ